jgi:pimeloyl-ACP methyl ester carboxylesterase
MPFATSNSAKIHYSVKGEAPRTVLLIMGLGGHASEWGEAFVDALALHYRVVTMDNRGIAQSQTRVETWTLEDMARDALAVLDDLGCQRVLLGGTSMGGMIAQLVAADSPERVEKLALMSTSFGGRESLPPTAAATALFTPMPGLSRGQLQRKSLEVLTGPGFAESHSELLDQFADQRQQARTRARVFQAQFAAILASDRSERVRDLKMPTLVLHGTSDQLVPVENGKLLAERIPGAKLVLFEGVGHFPHLEKPNETAAELHAFFAS